MQIIQTPTLLEIAANMPNFTIKTSGGNATTIRVEITVAQLGIVFPPAYINTNENGEAVFNISQKLKDLQPLQSPYLYPLIKSVPLPYYSVKFTDINNESDLKTTNNLYFLGGRAEKISYNSFLSDFTDSKRFITARNKAKIWRGMPFVLYYFHLANYDVIFTVKSFTLGGATQINTYSTHPDSIGILQFACDTILLQIPDDAYKYEISATVTGINIAKFTIELIDEPWRPETLCFFNAAGLPEIIPAWNESEKFNAEKKIAEIVTPRTSHGKYKPWEEKPAYSEFTLQLPSVTFIEADAMKSLLNNGTFFKLVDGIWVECLLTSKNYDIADEQSNVIANKITYRYAHDF
jgi:hypothetical protein